MAIRKNPLGPCIEMFKKEITAIELLDGPDEKATPKEIDLFARKQARALKTSIEKQLKRNVPLTEATNIAQKAWLDNHGRWWRAHKEHLLLKTKALADNIKAAEVSVAEGTKPVPSLTGKLVNQDFASWMSKTYDSHLNFYDRHVKGSISEIQNTNKMALESAFVQKMTKIAVELKLKYHDVLNHMIDPALEGKVNNSIMQDLQDDSASSRIGRAVKEITDQMLKMQRRVGIKIPDAGSDYIISQSWNPQKMMNPSDRLWNKYEKRPKETLNKFEYENAVRNIFANEVARHLNWETTYPDEETGTLIQRIDLTKRAFDSILGEYNNGDRPMEGRMGEGFMSYLENRSRRLHAKDGEGRAQMGATYGRTLLENLQRQFHFVAKNTALVQKLGPEPEAVHQEIKAYWKEKSTLDEWPDRENEIDEAFNSYTKFDYARGGLEKVTLAKNLKLGTSFFSLGNMGVNSFPDSAVMLSYLRAMNASDKAKTIMHAFSHFFFKKTRENDQPFLDLFNMAEASFRDAITEVTLNSEHSNYEPNRNIGKAAHFMGWLGGLSKWDQALKLAINKTWSKKLLKEKSLEYKDLPTETKDIYNQFNITEAEHNYLRNVDVAEVRLGGEGYLAPREYDKLTDKQISEMYGISPRKKVMIDQLRLGLATRFTTAMMYQSNYVVPELNARGDRMYQLHQVANAQTGATVYILWELLAQYKKWAFNFSSNVLGRINQGRGTKTSKIAQNLEIAVGTGALFSMLDYLKAAVTNQPVPDYNKDDPITSVFKHVLNSSISNFGAWGLVFNAISDLPTGQVQGIKAPGMSTVAHWGHDFFAVARPGPRGNRFDNVLTLGRDVANLNFPFGILLNQVLARMYTNDDKRIY